jgi:hypothetical protein
MSLIFFIRKNCSTAFLIFALMLVLVADHACKSPTEPPIYVFLERVEFIYTRNVANITNPQGDDERMRFEYELYDPSQPSVRDVIASEWSIRHGAGYMEKISENESRGYIENVLIHTSQEQPKHRVWVWDNKFYDGVLLESRWTGEGIEIERAYDYEIIQWPPGGTKLAFRISQD